MKSLFNSALANASVVTEREQKYCTMHAYECSFNYADDDNIDPGRFSCVSNYQAWVLIRKKFLERYKF